MAQVQIISDGPDYRHQIQAGTHVVVADEPATLGGQGAGMAPFELYLAALSACTAITLRMYAEKKGWDLGTFRAELSSSATPTTGCWSTGSCMPPVRSMTRSGSGCSMLSNGRR